MPRKSNWNSPTTAIRIPQHCADDLVAIAKLLDSPKPHWDEDIPISPQVIHRLSQFHSIVEVLVREIKRTEQPDLDRYQRLVNALWDAVERFKESNYRLFCQRIGQQPNPTLGKPPTTCPLLAGFKVADRCQAYGAIGQLVISHGPAEGDRYVTWQREDGIRQVFNRRLASDIQPLEVSHA